MSQHESELSRLIVRALNARGHLVWKNHGSVFSYKGLADITGLRKGDGVFIALEVKRPEKWKNLSPEQWKFLRDVNRTAGGAVAAVVCSVEEAINAVESKTVAESCL